MFSVKQLNTVIVVNYTVEGKEYFSLLYKLHPDKLRLHVGTSYLNALLHFI